MSRKPRNPHERAEADRLSKNNQVGIPPALLLHASHIVGTSADRFRNVLEGRQKATPIELADMLAKIENHEEHETVGLKLIEQRLINLASGSMLPGATPEEKNDASIRVPNGFGVHTFTTFIATFIQRLPTIAIDLAMRASKDTTPQEIGPGVEVMQRLERKGLILFAEHLESHQPALFVARPEDFEQDGDHLIALALVQYFDASGDFNARSGEIVSVEQNEGGGTCSLCGGPYTGLGNNPEPLKRINERCCDACAQNVVLPARMKRVPGDKIDPSITHTITVAELAASKDQAAQFKPVREDLKCSEKALHGLLRSLEERELIALRRDDTGGISVHFLVKDIQVLSSKERELITSVKRNFGTIFEDGRIKLDTDIVSADRPGDQTYMKAIETQYAALADISLAIQKERTKMAMGLPPTMVGAIRAVENYSIDAQILKRAETYCWFKTQTEAVVSAGITLPTSVRLDRDLTPVRSGWWYFVNPLNVKTTEGIHGNDDHVMAISWSWAVINEKTKDGKLGEIVSLEGEGRLGVILAAYIWAENRPVPSTQFFWSEGHSLGQMLIETETSLRRNFSDPDYKDGADALGRLSMTMTAVEQMARFFAAGNLWIQQKILVQQSRAMERHARKRFEKEGKTEARPLSDVQIIQLRRREVVALEKTKPGAGAVDWKCQWIVGGTTGFWRNQFYPSKGYHVPIHIDPFIKGPADKPLKVPTHRVYAVNR